MATQRLSCRFRLPSPLTACIERFGIHGLPHFGLEFLQTFQNQADPILILDSNSMTTNYVARSKGTSNKESKHIENMYTIVYVYSLVYIKQCNHCGYHWVMPWFQSPCQMLQPMHGWSRVHEVHTVMGLNESRKGSRGSRYSKETGFEMNYHWKKLRSVFARSIQVSKFYTWSKGVEKTGPWSVWTWLDRKHSPNRSIKN